MKKLLKYFLISLIIGAVLFSIVVFLDQATFLLEPVETGGEVTPITYPDWVFKLRSFFNTIAFYLFPIFLLILSLYYSVKESKAGFTHSVVGSLLVSLSFFLLSLVLALLNSVFSWFTGEEGMIFLFLLVVSAGLIAASFVINSIVYLVRRK